MTRFPIKLEDKHARQGSQRGQLVEAFLCLDVPGSLIAETVARWNPLWDAGLERRRRLGLPPLENEHWDWLAKSSWLSLAAYRSLGVECEGVMQGIFNQVQRDDAWVLRMADAEEGASIRVGGLHGRLDTLQAEAARRSLAQFIELSRRQLGLSLAQLAEKAQVRLTDLVAIETGKGAVGSPETLIRLAAFLGVDAQPLLCLAGLGSSEDRQLDEVAVQFSARLEPVAPLEPREQEALDWFKSEAFRHRSHAVKAG